MSKIQEILGDEKYEQARALLKRSFPDTRSVVSNELLDSALACLPKEVQIALCGVELVLEAVKDIGQLALSADPEVVGYYRVDALHERRTGAGRHAFIGELPMVRIRLPQTEERDISSKIGVCYAGDRLTYTAELVRQKYQRLCSPDFIIDRVELLTCPRFLGARFAAVSAYLLFDREDFARAYIFEAGMATGEPVVQFFAKRGEKIHAPTWYEPTPMSKPTDWFEGSLSFSPVGGLRSGFINVKQSEHATPHFSTTLGFHRLPQAPEAVFYSSKTVEAAIRVAKIQVARGEADAVMKILAMADVEWVKEPKP